MRRSRGRPGPTAPATPASPQANTRQPHRSEGAGRVLAGGVRAWPGFETTHPATDQPPCATVVEGAGGPGRGAGGRRRGLAGLRDDAPSKARGADGERAGRPRGGRRSVGATSPPHTPRRHNKTARPQWGRAAVAVALGFEPRVAVTPHSISSAAPSAARTRYLTRILYYTLPLRAQIDRACWEEGHTAAWEQGHNPESSHGTSKTSATSAFRTVEYEIK